jgi:hypothetical protein
MSAPIKTKRAKKVLQLMDSTIDGPDRYTDFVKQVSKETGVPVSQIERELEAFI